MIFTRHARRRMIEPGITESDVRQGFKDPIAIAPADGGNQKLIALVRGKRICVVFGETDRDRAVLLSSWWME